ncbi:MAG: hypothetical protein IJK70_07640 [Bacteroidales bacterium]|nr:hypothetical protein [Bacteroidales bacterium]
MTKVQAIKAEIERMHQEAVLAACGNDTDWLRSRIGTCVDILAFIDSLPEEKGVMMINESVTTETLVPLSIMDETIEDAASMLVKQQLAQAVGRRLLQEGFLDFDVQKFDYNRIRVRCTLSFTMLKNT